MERSDSVNKSSRRAILQTGVKAAALGFLIGVPPCLAKEEVEATPLEDLMHEHGILNRLLLIYDNIEGRLRSDEKVDFDVLSRASEIMGTYIEVHHVVMEEEFIFPTLVKANQLKDIVAVLLEQHKAGKELTSLIRAASRQGSSLRTSSNASSTGSSPSLLAQKRRALANNLRGYVTMFRPHEAWEDTVIYPAFRKVLGRKGYHSIGEKMERVEHERFGEDSFDDVVASVAELEKELGIYSLAKFSAKPGAEIGTTKETSKLQSSPPQPDIQ